MIIRLGFMFVKGMGKKAERLTREREKAPFSSLEDFFLRVGLDSKPVENLILAGAFDTFGSSKRDLLWQLGLLEKRVPGRLPLKFPESVIGLPPLTDLDEMKAGYSVLGLSLKHHPMEILRKRMGKDELLRSSEIVMLVDGAHIRVAGYVISRQSPATAKSFRFLSLEDEEGIMNVVVRPVVYER